MMQVQDNLGVLNNPKLKDMFSPTETLLYSGELLKINKKKLKQKRKIIITTENLYNMRDDNIFLSALSNMGLTSLIKRQIPITKITAIVYARLGNEFVIHVPDEFDYRIIDRHKDKLIEYILYALKQQEVEELQFYFNSEVELHKYTTHNSHKKKGIQKNPQGETKMMTLDDFRDFVNEKLRLIRQDEDNTEMLINFLNNYNKITIADFNLQKIVGRGGFATVFKCEKKDTGEIFALKSVRKLAVIEKNQFESIRREKEIQHDANHPFLVGLKCAFQTPDKLFFLMPFIECGDLSVHLRKRRFFFENEVKFYTAQIILALNFQHTKDIIYQDLKPANQLLETNGYIKLTDFGAAKYSYQTKKYRTFIGTLDYIAPEVLKRQPYTKSVDWWSLGILTYQQLYGKLPYYDKNPKNVVNKILTQEIEFDDDESTTTNGKSDECKNFITCCMVKDPTKRIGYENAEEQLSHDWFSDLDIQGLQNYSVNAPLIPEMPDEEDEDENEENDKEKDIDSPRLSVLEEGILNEIQKFDPMFKGFYLDQLNTPAPQTPAGVTPPPELVKNNINSSKQESENLNLQEKESQKSRSRTGSYLQEDIKSVNIKQNLDVKNDQDDEFLTSTKNEDTKSKTNQSQSNKHFSSKVRDLHIDTRNNHYDDNDSEGVGSCLRSPVQQSPSIGSTTEKNRFSYKYEICSRDILFEKQESLGIQQQDEDIVSMDPNITKASSKYDSINNKINRKLGKVSAGEIEDEEQIQNLEVYRDNIDPELSDDLDENTSNQGDKSPFSTRSDQLKNKMKLVNRQQKDNSDKKRENDKKAHEVIDKDTTRSVNNIVSDFGYDDEPEKNLDQKESLSIEQEKIKESKNEYESPNITQQVKVIDIDDPELEKKYSKSPSQDAKINLENKIEVYSNNLELGQDCHDSKEHITLLKVESLSNKNDTSINSDENK